MLQIVIDLLAKYHLTLDQLRSFAVESHVYRDWFTSGDVFDKMTMDPEHASFWEARGDDLAAMASAVA